MGKIRVKTFDESQEAQDAKLAAKREAKKARLQAAERSDGGQAAKAAEKVERTEISSEQREAPPESGQQTEAQTEAIEPQTEAKLEKKASKKEKFAKAKKSPSKRYKENASMVAVKTTYPLNTAVEMLKKFKTSKFDETVELHVNLKEKGVNGALSLPHGTGKKRVIKIADDETIAAIEKGTIDFDVLVAHPSMMPKLAKVARILGPRGLMPNPKNGTVTPKPEEMVEKLSGGLVNFKSESDAPIIHMSVGKISFSEPQIKENVTAAINAIKIQNITKVTMKSTMSPALQIELNSLGK